MEFWEDSRYVRHIRRGPGVPYRTIGAALLAGGAVALAASVLSAHPAPQVVPGALPPGVQALGGAVPSLPGLLPTYGPLTPGRRLPAPTTGPSTPGWAPETPTPGPVFTVPPPASSPAMAMQGGTPVPTTVRKPRYPAPLLSASAYPSSGPPPTPSPDPTPSASPVPSVSPTPHPSPDSGPSHHPHDRKHKP